MMRVLDHGYKVKMEITYFDVYSVDTEQDRLKVVRLMENDELIPLYSDVVGRRP